MRASFVFSEVVTGLRRNVTMTIAMILTTAISLGLLGGGLLVVRLIDKMQDVYYAQAEVTVFLTDDISANDKNCTQSLCLGARTALGNDPLVESVTFENRDEGYQRFQKLFADQPELIKLTRPEAIPAALHVKMKDPTRSNVIVQQFSGQAGVKSVSAQSQFLKQLFDVFNGLRNGVFVLALIQALAALLLISNTIQVSAFTRRTEVGIMRLVGATRWYTQLPFLLEAMVAGVVGAVVAICLLVLSKSLFVDKALASLYKTNVIPRLGFGDIALVSPWLLLAAVLISVVTGYATLRLYVRL